MLLISVLYKCQVNVCRLFILSNWSWFIFSWRAVCGSTLPSYCLQNTTKHWRQGKTWNVFLLLVLPSLLLYAFLCQSLNLSICFSLSLVLSHVFPLTITPRLFAANKSSRPGKWHLNVNAASHVPKSPQCTVSHPAISSVACVMVSLCWYAGACAHSCLVFNRWVLYWVWINSP